MKLTAIKTIATLPFLAFSLAGAAEPCRIEVVEKGTDWPVSLVELRTTHHARFITDNAGVIAFDLPELLGRETWFDVIGNGYEVAPDGFGYRGVRLTPEPGKTLRLEVERTIIAKRLGRLTGGGLFAESPMLQKMIYRDRDESIELTNRCVIEVQTASHRGTRGYTVPCVILDEVAFWLSEGANPDAEIIAALRPSMATLGGKLIALSSPYARRGVLWNAYRRHYGVAGRILVAQAPSLTMNPTLPRRRVA